MGETEGLVLLFCIWSVLIIGEWVVLAWSRKSYLRPDEIPSCVFLILFMNGGRKVSRNVISMFLMRIKGRRRVEFKIFLRGPRDGKIFLRSSAAKNRKYAIEMACEDVGIVNS